MSGETLHRLTAADGGEPGRRHDPDRADRGEPALALRARAAVHRAASTARCSRPACTTGSSARASTGATTRSSASRRSWSTARCRGCPGDPPLGGEILSHDFVEAALMGRAGWALWLAYDLPGSWEETPSSLLEEMKRDRRWCQGNIQHLRLLPTEGLYGAHRALFLNGVLVATSRRCSGSASCCSPPPRESGKRCASRSTSRKAAASFPSGRCGDPTGRSRSPR